MNCRTYTACKRGIAMLSAIGALGFLVAHGYAATVEKPDMELVTKAAGAGMMEVQAGKLAETHASNAAVKSFANRMVRDHGQVNDELKALSAKTGIDVPDTLPAKEQADVDKLSALQGGEFDRTYTREFGVKAHKEAVALFERGSRQAKDADLKAFFTHNLPAVREHLQMAEQLNP